MGYFSGVEDAQISGGGVYFLEGHYVCEIVKCHMLKSRKREDLFIVECKIVKSTCAQRPVGLRCSWVVKMSQDAALGNIKQFVAAANGIDPQDDATVKQEVTEAVCELVVSSANPLAGTLIDLEAVNVTTRAGNPFTLHKWNPCAEPVSAAG